MSRAISNTAQAPLGGAAAPQVPFANSEPVAELRWTAPLTGIKLAVPMDVESRSRLDGVAVVVDNGSSVPFSHDYVESLGPHFKYYYIENASPSPAPAVNFGVKQSSGRFVGIMVDGARILTPGIMKYARHANQSYQNPVVCTMGWHLGPDLQNRSILNGYNQEVEDQLLASIDWSNNGYRLFDVSSLAGSSKGGWFTPIAESNCLFMRRDTFDRLGGYDERFDLPGGGLVNHDLYARACELPDTELVMMLGEGNFHQVHGGTATNVSEEKSTMLWKEYEAQYCNIRKKRYVSPVKRPDYIGHVPREALRWMVYSAEPAIQKHLTIQG